VLVYNDKHWRTFFQLIGRADVFAADARFQTAAQRARNYDFIYGCLAEVLLARPRAEWLDMLSKADIPCAPVNTVDELIDDPHLRDIDFLSLRETPMGLERDLGPGADVPSGPAPGTGNTPNRCCRNSDLARQRWPL
jgi:crotonobetainyl-CoA:carnitine CoA-transferase CaiB-like acyl-CoA transferase